MSPLYSWCNSGNFLNYADRLRGVTWAANGYSRDSYYTGTNAKEQGHPIAGPDIGKSTEPPFFQKTS